MFTEELWHIYYRTMIFEIVVTAILGILSVYIYSWTFTGNALKSSTQEEVNFLKIFLLCQKHATDAVRLIFDNHVPNSKITTHLGTFRGLKWNTNEQNLLCPVSGGSANSNDFDFSLLYKLIRNTFLNKIAPPTRGWGPKPLPGDELISDDIERIRYYRNAIAHNTELKINDKEFQDQWNDLSQAINRLSQGAMKPEILALQCNQFVGSQTNEMKNVKQNICKIRDEMYELQNDVIGCKNAIGDIEDAVIGCRRDIHEARIIHIPDHIREGQLRILKDWKRHDIVFCNKTRGYKEAYEEVNKELMVTFIGGPGSGKTVTGRHIALLFERMGWEVIPIYKEDEIVRYGNGNIRQVFLLDDVLGSFTLDMSRLNNIVACKKTILNSINNRSKIVFTCRKIVYNEAIVLKPFVLEHIVDLESKNNELNELEKIHILTNHCLKAGVDEKLYINLSLKAAKIMFPFLCQLFAANVKYQMIGSDFFERPFDYLLEELSRLQKTNTAQYVSLVLCLVNDRKLSMENLPSKNVKKRIYNSCGLDRGTADRKIIDALSHIEGTYVVLIESEYSFIHDSIYEAIAFHYGQVFPEQILDYMPSNFIANKVTVFGNTSNDALSIEITEKYFSRLAERLYSDLESYQLFDVFMNKALKCEPFLDVFIQLIRKKPYKDFKKTLLGHKFSFFGECDHLINSKEKNEETGNTYYDETFKRELLTDKREGEIEDKNLRYIIHRLKVISWVVYYGHIRLLQEIVEHVHDHNESSDLVFGSNTEEQARLLVLSVYNGNPGLIELVLKYVKKESISSSSMYMDDDFLEANHHRTLSPLTAACQFNNFQIVELLVRAGADVNLGDFAYEFPIYVASENGYYEIVKYLVQNGADVNKNIPNMYMISGCVPSLYIAAIQGYYDIVKCLVQNGADVDITGFCNMTPLFQASAGGFIEIVKILVESGADVNFCDNNNRSPLFVASEEGHSDVVSYLIKNGGDVNMCNELGTSPLLASIENGHLNVLKTLLDNNAQVKNQLSGEKIAFMIALEKGRVEIGNFLLQNGADHRMKNECGVTTMQIALWKNYSEILQQIVSLENRRKPLIGTFQLFQLLVDLCDFEVFPGTSCSIKRSHNYPLLSFISKDTDGDGINHLVKLGLGSKLDNNKKHLLLEYAIRKSGVTKRVEKVKSLFDLCKSSNVRDQDSVSLLECTRKLFEQNKTLLKESEYRWTNHHKEVFLGCLEDVGSLLANRQDKNRRKTVSKQDVEEYWSIMVFLKQRIRRFSV